MLMLRAVRAPTALRKRARRFVQRRATAVLDAPVDAPFLSRLSRSFEAWRSLTTRPFSSELVGRAEEQFVFKTGFVCDAIACIDGASPFFHRVILRLRCREDRLQRAPATGAAAGRAPRSRAPRRTTNRSNYAKALYSEPSAALDDLREAVATLTDTERISRRVLGGAHPLTEGMEDALEVLRAAFRTP